jgi:DNA-binding MarR family transcriptional regulator
MCKDNNSVPLSRKLITTIIKKATKSTESLSFAFKEHGITVQQFNVLRILRGRQGEVASLQDVSKNMIHSNSNTTRVIDKLVIKNYVGRVQCPTDRRQIELTITPSGLELLKILDHIVDEIETKLTKKLDAKMMETLINALEKI